MTLVKKQIKRLWYSTQDATDSIPSRTWTGLSEEKFEKRIPKEFWAEVVERVNKEVLDTLLLAEAFWFMEGYFVCTLGMNRVVYNSKRYVNFMSNPNEKLQ